MRVALLACFVWLLPALGGAQDVDAEAASRDAFERGRAAMSAGRPGDAADAFEEAFALLPRLSTAFNLALASHAAGRWEDAARMLETVASGALGELETEQGAAVARLRREVTRHVGRIAVQLRGAPASGAWLRVDGSAPRSARQSETIFVRPGAHTIEASGEGVLSASAEVRVAAGAERALVLSLVRATGTLRVEFEERDRAISIDGREAGRGAVELELAPGSYHASVEGCDACATEVDVRAGTETHVVLGRGGDDEAALIALVVVASLVAAAGAASAIALAVDSAERGPTPPESDPVFGVVVALRFP